MKTFHNLGLVAALSLLMANPVPAQVREATQTIVVLPPDVSKGLNITLAPLSRPVPLIVGNYWTCSDRTGLSFCRLVMVVCSDDQQTCIEIP